MVRLSKVKLTKEEHLGLVILDILTLTWGVIKNNDAMADAMASYIRDVSEDYQKELMWGKSNGPIE